jgi:hypothetical protein
MHGVNNFKFACLFNNNQQLCLVSTELRRKRLLNQRELNATELPFQILNITDVVVVSVFMGCTHFATCSARLAHTFSLHPPKVIYVCLLMLFVSMVLLSRCSYLLWAGRSGYRVLVGARFSAPVYSGPGTHPAFCAMGTGSPSRI